MKQTILKSISPPQTLRSDTELLAFKLKPRIPVIDIAGHHSVCELNYFRLLRLLPAKMKDRILEDSRTQYEQDKGVHQSYLIDMNQPDQRRELHLTVTDSAPFTSTIELVQSAPNSSVYEQVPRLVVRLYHDAQMAEIISWDRHRQWQPRYSYPNPQMYQPDEKLALNRFLADWLSFVQDRALVCAY